ncbi:nitroreductase [Sulfuricella denitrificans skB26]|uniref:Nitroreductase n=1 Tax=Sulfuricella denitrificans (strain DSM 22764 / NBRC 105220 / skB26) TaxID=1163617 RepID=S6AAJ9_SULDS|nr:nitroreductase family protein [Sulfuricella denitrificans]BAN35990.1 nitroreductase [Sulfuricella denitrificans skB26]
MEKWIYTGLFMMSVTGNGWAQETDAGAEQKALYSATDTGFIAQNVYFFCTSAGLATVVRGSIDRAALGAVMGLGSHQQIILAQSVGYPAKYVQ